MRIKKWGVFLLLGFIFSGCETRKNTNPLTADSGDGTSGGYSQIFMVTAEYSASYWDEASQTEVYTPNVGIQGHIAAKTVPVYEYYEINGVQYTRDFAYEAGSIIFGEYADENGDYVPVTGNIQTLNFKGKTSLGAVQGTVQLPDTITHVTLSSSNLSLNQSLTVSWTGSNAEYYFIEADYEWNEGGNNYGYKDLDTLITGNSVTFPGSLFSHDGYVDIDEIIPFNGPLPAAGAVGNLTGGGTGFFSYEGLEYEINAYIKVGSGMYKKETSGLQKSGSRNKREKQMRLFDRMINAVE